MLHNDVLEVELSDIQAPGPYRVVANLPYNVAGRIAMHLLESWGAAVGSMTLTLYSAHLLALAAMLHYEVPLLWLLIHAVGAALFAVAWQRAYGQGPLERVLAQTAAAKRRKCIQPPPLPHHLPP